MSDKPFNLASALPGTFLCSSVDDNGANPVRMKSLGICEGRELELVSRGDPMIVQVAGARVGLSRMLASSVSVTKSQRVVPNKAK